MSNGICMKLTHVQGEVLLAAADSDLINREFSSGKLKIKVLPEFYGETSVNDVTFLSSLGICTIANLVGKHAIDLAVEEGLVDRENILMIGDVPHAQFARMTE
ncbi:MAG: DUF424 family protein [Thermoplasmataceae archaeon]|jgi:hypothetical protein